MAYDSIMNCNKRTWHLINLSFASSLNEVTVTGSMQYLQIYIKGEFNLEKYMA